MHYSALLSLTLATSSNALGVSLGLGQGIGNLLGGGKSRGSSDSGTQSGTKNTGGSVSDLLNPKGVLDKLPKVGPNSGRISVPGRPPWQGEGKTDGSPDYPYVFTNPLPIPDIAKPLFTEEVNGVPIDYYELTIEEFETQLFPDRGTTKLIGYE